MRVAEIHGSGVFDSNGTPTIEVEVRLEDGTVARASAPHGSTTGQFEATIVEAHAELPSRRAVQPALELLRAKISPWIEGHDVDSVDDILCALDPSPTKALLGGNVTIAVSMAAWKAKATSEAVSILHCLRKTAQNVLPIPMFNVLDGSRSRNCRVPAVEFLLLPICAGDVEAALELGSRVRQHALTLVHERGLSESGGDSPQGAVSVMLDTCEEGLELVDRAARHCRLQPYDDYTLGLDLGAADHYDRPRSRYTFPWAPPGGVEPDELLDRYLTWTQTYPISYLEDGFSETDTKSWRSLCERGGETLCAAGDDLFASSAARIRAGAADKWANAALIKPN